MIIISVCDTLLQNSKQVTFWVKQYLISLLRFVHTYTTSQLWCVAPLHMHVMLLHSAVSHEVICILTWNASDAVVTCGKDVIDILALQRNCGVVWTDINEHSFSFSLIPKSNFKIWPLCIRSYAVSVEVWFWEIGIQKFAVLWFHSFGCVRLQKMQIFFFFFFKYLKINQ